MPIGPIPAGETEPPTLLIDYAGRRLRAGAYVELGFGGFVHISGSFVFEMGTVLNDQLLDNGTTKDLSVMKIGASNVNVFLGDGGPYWVDSNGDGVINTNPADAIADDTPDAAGAVGIALGGVEVAVVLLKTVPPATPTTPAAPALSYYAISAHAESIALVGVDGVTVQGTSIDVAVNGGGGAPTGTAPNQIPAPVVDFNGAADDESLPVTVDIETGATRDIAFDGFVLEASGTITVAFEGFSIVTTIAFSQALRSNGQKVTKISLTETTFSVGIGDPAFTISGANGFILLTPQGMAAQIDVAATTVNIGPDFSFSTAFSVKINNTNKLVNEEFIVPGTGPFVLELPAGPYLRIEATDVNLTLKGFAFHADAIAIERIVKVPGTPPVQLTRFIATGVSATTFTAEDLEGDPTGFSLTNGRMAFVIYPGTPAAGGGVAGIVSGTITLDTGGAFDVEGAATLQVNRTNVQRKESIPAGDGTASFDLAPNVFKIAVRQLSVRVLDIFELTGDFFFEDSTGGQHLRRAQRDAVPRPAQLRRPDRLHRRHRRAHHRRVGRGRAVLQRRLPRRRRHLRGRRVRPRRAARHPGPGRHRLAAGADQHDRPGRRADDHAAAAARRHRQRRQRGIDEDDEDDGIDNDNDGTIDELAERQINVNFASGVRTEVFEVGLDQYGLQLEPLKLDAAGIFVVEGSMRFTRHPSGRLEVDVPNVSVKISIPLGAGNLQEIIKVSGVARFSFGGQGGFQLQDLRVNGFALFGQTIVDAAVPSASTQRPVEADLAGPFAGQNVPISFFDADEPYIDVIFRDPNFQGINRETIIDPGDEFIITGPGANVAVNGAAVQIDPTNPFLFRYFLTKINSGEDLFTLGGNPADPRNTVRIEFLANSFQNSLGATNAADFESFYLFQGTSGFAAFTTAAEETAPPVPTAMLASPFSGSTLNQRSASSRPWIDVIFLPNQAGKVVGISGDEIRLTGAGTNNLVKNASGIVQLTLGTQVAPNTWRYYVTPKPGVALQQIWAQGTVEVSFLATVPGDVNHSPTWCVLPVDAPTTATCADATEEQKPGAGFGSFTLDPNVIDAAQSNTPRAIGPLTLTNLAVSLVGTTFKDGKLALTIGIGADSAELAFGRTNSTAANANPNQPPPGPNAVADQERRLGHADRPAGHVRRARRHRQGVGRAEQPGRAARRVRRAGQVHARRRHVRGDHPERRHADRLRAARRLRRELRPGEERRQAAGDPAPEHRGHHLPVVRRHRPDPALPRQRRHHGAGGDGRRPRHTRPRRHDGRPDDRPRRAALQAGPADRERRSRRNGPRGGPEQPAAAAGPDTHDADGPGRRLDDQVRLDPRVRRPAHRRHQLQPRLREPGSVQRRRSTSPPAASSSSPAARSRPRSLDRLTAEQGDQPGLPNDGGAAGRGWSSTAGEIKAFKFNVGHDEDHISSRS